MVELIVALAVMSLVSVGVATGIYGLMSSQKGIVNRIDAGEFAGGLARSMTEKVSCSSHMNGLPTPVNWTDLSIPNYQGYGGVSGQALGPGTILSGTAANPSLRVAGMQWRIKPGASGSPVTIGGVQKTRTTMQVRLNLESSEGGRIVALPVREVEFTVLRNNANQVDGCEGEPSMNDSCKSLGTTYDEKTGTCLPDKEECLMRGTYVNSWCDKTPCQATSKSPPTKNEYTNGFSCPSGSKPMSTFNYTWTSNEQVGKKDFRLVKNNIRAFICLQCPEE